MICSQCRAVLRLDHGLENLNAAGFNLLTNEDNESTAIHDERIQESNNTCFAGQPEMREIYAEASVSSRGPMHRKTVEVRDNSMSFVVLSKSQVESTVPLPDATIHYFKNNDNIDRIAQIDLTPPKVLSTAKSDDDDDDDTSAHGINLSQRMVMVNRLFEILSARSNVDHPICYECCNLLANGLQERLNTLSKERDVYMQFLREAEASVPLPEEWIKAQKELDNARNDEQNALKELEILECERAKLREEIASLNKASWELDSQAEEFWRRRNECYLKFKDRKNEHDGLMAKIEHKSNLLKSLQRTDVFNDTFNIGHDGPFGTINGLRLGKASSSSGGPVEWAEINAALGQTCLLVSTVANILKFDFDMYRLNPMGSFSTIDRIDRLANASTSVDGNTNVTSYDLFCKGDRPLGLAFLNRRFDTAMIAFLDCIRQLGEWVEAQSNETSDSGCGNARKVKMPYSIHKDRIHDVSICLAGFNQEESWTKACKYLLTYCKFLLTYASHR